MKIASSQCLLVGTGIGLQACRFNPGDGAHLVLVRRVTGNATGANDVAATVPDKDPAGICDHPAAARRREHGEKLRRLGCAAGKRAGAETHAKGAPCLAERNVETQDPRFVLTLISDEMAAGVEDRDRERRKIAVACLFKRDVNDSGSLCKSD